MRNETKKGTNAKTKKKRVGKWRSEGRRRKQEMIQELLKEKDVLIRNLSTSTTLIESGALSAGLAHEFNQFLTRIEMNADEALHLVNSSNTDIDNLKRKVDAGANRIITQFFFDSDVYFRFVDLCHKNKIYVPIVPGILPVTNVKQTKHFAKMCGAKIPKWMENVFEGLDENQETRQLVAGIVATELCRILHNSGVDDFHFYTLNRSDLTLAICHLLGVRSVNVS